MKNVPVENECIQLSLPVNAAYVSAARLTASSIANRMNFDIDEIEDIKAAVSEACTFIIKKLTYDKNPSNSDFQIKFQLMENLLEISINASGQLEIVPDEEEMSLLMIKALMDKFELLNDSAKKEVTVFMTKVHKILELA